MVLNHLSLSETQDSSEIKSILEDKLQTHLPKGSFSVILRSYQGDFRARKNNRASYNAIILVDDQGRKAALAYKHELEHMGFRISSKGDISVN